MYHGSRLSTFERWCLALCEFPQNRGAFQTCKNETEDFTFARSQLGIDGGVGRGRGIVGTGAPGTNGGGSFGGAWIGEGAGKAAFMGYSYQ